MPAACCGVVGLKPTWGRDSNVGGPRGVKSLVSTGPIAATVADAAIMYAVTGNAGWWLFRHTWSGYVLSLHVWFSLSVAQWEPSLRVWPPC